MPLRKLRIAWLLIAVTLSLGGSMRAQAADPSDLCRLLTTAAVSQALHTAIVRAERPGSRGDAGCEYSIKATPSEAATAHATAIAKNGPQRQGGQLGAQGEKLFQMFGKTVLKSSDDSSQVRHSGEVVALSIELHTGNAQTEMKLNRQTLGMMSPVTSIAELGDEAFDTAQSTLMVRKGSKILRMQYLACPCTAKDVVPLARQIVKAL